MTKKSTVSACVLAAMTALGLLAPPVRGQVAYEAYKSKNVRPQFGRPSMIQQMDYMQNAVNAL